MIVLFLYVFLGLSFLLTFLDLTNLSFEKKKYIFIFLGLCIIIIETFREGMGYDYDAYLDIYNATPPITDWINRWMELFSGRLTFVELLYLVVNGVVQAFFGNYQLVFFSMACISFFAYYKTITKMTPYIFSTFLVYISTVFFYKELGQIRHGVAMALSLYSVYLLLNGNKKKFLITNTIAVLFHKAVLPSYLLIFLKNIRWKKWNSACVLFGCLVLYIFDISGFLISHIGSISTFAAQTESIENAGVDGLVSLEKFLFPFFVATISVIFLDKGGEKYPYFHIELTMLLLGICIMAAFHGYKEFGQRLSAGLLLSEIFLLPQVCIGVPQKISGKILGWLIVILLCGIYIYHTLQTFPMP